MWTTFLPDVLVAAIGAVLTVLVAIASYVISKRRRERVALQALINHLHGKRALLTLPGSSPKRRIRGAAKLPDFQHAAASVLDIKSEIKGVREVSSVSARWQQNLAKMLTSCNLYLEQSQAEPYFYPWYLDDLRRELEVEVRALTRSRKGLSFARPGDGALPAQSVSMETLNASHARR